MVKLVRGQDNVISLHITSTYPVGEVSGTFVAKSVTIPVPQSRNGTEFKFTAADVESIGEDFMIGVMTLKNEANEEVAVVRVPLAVLPEGSDNRGFTDVRITIVSIREVEGGDHGGAGVKMFPTKDDFPVKGNVRYIYLAEDTGKMYRWDAAAEDYVEVSGVVHANLEENNPGKDGYVLNRQTSFLYNDGWDGTHPYASVANFVPDYNPETTYSKNDVVFHEYKTTGGTDNGIFKCLADGTMVAPPDASKWIEIDLKDLIGKEVVVTDKTGATPTGGEEIWIDETETPDGQSYNDLVDKPQINGHELTGNKTSRQLGIVDTTDLDKKLSKQRVDGDATKGQVEWEELDDHRGCLKVTGVVKGTNVETADGKHNLADKADKETTLAGYGITDAATKEELAAKADLVDGKVPAAQLPSYVDDVLEYGSKSEFPASGENSKIYVAKDTNLVYRWSGTQYVEISPSPVLDDTVTKSSPNGVKSSGIWSWVNAAIAESSVFIKTGGSEDEPPIRFSLNAPELMSFFNMRKTHLNHLTRISFDGSPEQIVFYDGTPASKDLLQILDGKANHEDLAAKRDKTDLDIKLPSIESCTWGTPDTELRNALIGVVPVFSNGKWSAVAGQWTSNLVPGTGYEESISFLFSGLRDDVPANATLVRGEPETVDSIAKKSEMTAGLAAKQSKITASGILKGDGQGGVTAATKSSTSADPANADYRDPTDNTCHKTEFTEWSFSGEDYDPTATYEMFFKEIGSASHWELFENGEHLADSQIGATGSDTTVGGFEDYHYENPVNITATRSGCTDGKKFVTSDVVDGKVSSAVSTKYTKPSGGIPASDLALTVQNSLDAADAAAPQATTYTKDETDAAIRAGASLGQMTNLGNGRYEYTGALEDASTQTYPREEA